MVDTVYKRLEKAGKNPGYARNPKQPYSIDGYISQELLNIYKDSKKSSVKTSIKNLKETEENIIADKIFSETYSLESWKYLATYFNPETTAGIPSEKEMIQLFIGVKLFTTFNEVYGENNEVVKKYMTFIRPLSELKNKHCGYSANVHTFGDILDPLHWHLESLCHDDQGEKIRYLAWKNKSEARVTKWKNQGYIDKGEKKDIGPGSQYMFYELFLGKFWKVGWVGIGIIAFILVILIDAYSPRTSSSAYTGTGSSSYTGTGSTGGSSPSGMGAADTERLRRAAEQFYDRCTANPRGPGCSERGFK